MLPQHQQDMTVTDEVDAVCSTGSTCLHPCPCDSCVPPQGPGSEVEVAQYSSDQQGEQVQVQAPEQVLGGHDWVELEPAVGPDDASKSSAGSCGGGSDSGSLLITTTTNNDEAELSTPPDSPCEGCGVWFPGFRPCGPDLALAAGQANGAPATPVRGLVLARGEEAMAASQGGLGLGSPERPWSLLPERFQQQLSLAEANSAMHGGGGHRSSTVTLGDYDICDPGSGSRGGSEAKGEDDALHAWVFPRMEEPGPDPPSLINSHTQVALDGDACDTCRDR